MCGICGEITLDGSFANLAHIEAMLPALRRRGPDQQGAYAEGAVALGHRRLAIIDLSQKAHQPMVDPLLGLVLVFNGTIYNYRALRQTLLGHGYTFFSDGDTEVIIKAYHFWREKCVLHFEGMFAFAIWDKNEQQLFIARDRMGIKPLYFTQSGRLFRFASNMQSLLANPQTDRTIDPVGLHFQFSLHGVVPAPYTVVKGIRKCPPGCHMTVKNGKIGQPIEYWSLNDIEINNRWHEAEWQERIHHLLQQAVAKRIYAADVPVGVLLSGGLDSSLLVALLHEIEVGDLRTFSVGFEDQPEEKGNEFEYSDSVVERFGTRHRKFIVPNPNVLNVLPACIAQMSEPMFGQDAVAFYLLSEQVAKEIKVVQSGQGADEVFAGYFWYPHIAHSDLTPLAALQKFYFDREHDEYCKMIAPPFLGGDFTSAWVAEQLAAMRYGESLDKVLRLDVTRFIVDDPVKRVDNMTMAWGLEARVPFLDHHLVELAASMPASMKMQQDGKHSLKLMACTRLPAKVIDRPKGYFPMPALKYIRGEFLQWMSDTLQSDACRQRGVFSPHYVQQVLAHPEKAYTRIKGSKLWHMALFEAWCQQHIDTAGIH